MKITKNYMKDFATKWPKSINLRSKTHYIDILMCKIILFLCQIHSYVYANAGICEIIHNESWTRVEY